MSVFNLVNNWRKILNEEKSTPIGSPEYKKHTGQLNKDKKIVVPYAPDKEPVEPSYYQDVIKQAEKSVSKNIEDEEEKAKKEKEKKQSKKPTGKIKSSCNCVDSSESGLSVKQIKGILNQHFKSNPSFANLPIDNNCDSKTKKAIMQFQADTGAEQDGCVGDETELKMKEAGYIDKVSTPTKTYSSTSTSVSSEPSADIDQDSGSTATSFSSAPSGGGGGVEVTVIKSNVPGYSPHRAVVKVNYQGYGRDTASAGNTENDAYFINGINVADYLTSNAKGIKIRSGRKKRQFGTTILATALADAANFAHAVGEKLNRVGGEAMLSDVSYGGCQNEKERRKDPNMPCIQGGWHKDLGSHRWGHQSGLEADVSYYKTQGASGPWDAVATKMRYFDYERNCAFLESLLKNKRMEMVLLSRKVVKRMQKWVEENGKQSQYPNVLSSPKIGYDKRSGHDDHYHIRMMIPDGAPNMKQFRARIKNSSNIDTPVSSLTASDPKTLKGAVARLVKLRSKIKPESGQITPFFNVLKNLELRDLQKIYGNQFGYCVGRLEDDEPSISNYNAKKRFYGASSPKTIAGLMQLIKFKGTGQELNTKEVNDLLRYTNQAVTWSPRGSNAVNRSISSSFGGQGRKNGRDHKGRRMFIRKSGKRIGVVRGEDFENSGLNAAFDMKNSGFLWGRTKGGKWGSNTQTPRDMFKFFTIIERMYNAIITQNFRSLNSIQQSFARQHQNEIKKIVETQRKRAHSPNIRLSGMNKIADGVRAWGKGGHAMHAVSHTFVVKKGGKAFGMSVYVDLVKLHKGMGGGPGGSEEGYALLNVLLLKLYKMM